MSADERVVIKHKIINSIIELKKIFMDEGVKIENIHTLTFNACDIVNIDFNFLSVKNLRFEKCDICNCEWLNMNLFTFKISRSSLRYCYFDNCYFTNIDINTSEVVRTTFTKCVFNRFDINSSRMPSSVLHRVRTKRLCANSIEPFKMTHLSETSGFKSLPMKCPRKGEFIGWKKCYYAVFSDDECKRSECIVKLSIPSDAKRSSGLGDKCRCSKAKVLGIYDINHEPLLSSTEAFSSHDINFVYHVGELVYPDGFDDDRFIECSNGIHFFMSFEEAVEY